MLNALRCRKTATRFAVLAELCENAEQRNEYVELERLWSDMAGIAERFDREHDDYSKALIYALMGQIDIVRRKYDARATLVAEPCASDEFHDSVSAISRHTS